MSDTARDDGADRSKASFKLDLLETVNADPQMQPSDLALLLAHLSVMKWPKRRAWLSTSRARAMTSLSERQVITSRQRLQARGYMAEAESNGATRIFQIDNPRLEDMRQHVAIETERLKENQAERQAERRRLARGVSANSAGTKEAMSQSPGECDVSANSAGYYPSSPQEEALKKEQGFKVSPVLQTDPHVPFPVSESEDYLHASLSALFAGCTLSPAVLKYFRHQLMDGTLTPAKVQEHRRIA